ncbi:unnamed protein product, partial [Mesorhabditis spiculigera]
MQTPFSPQIHPGTLFVVWLGDSGLLIRHVISSIAEIRAKKLIAYDNAKLRVTRKQELLDRRERVRKAQEEMQQAREQAPYYGFENADFSCNAELKDLFKDPEVMAALSDCISNPDHIHNYIGNAKVVKVLRQFRGFYSGGTGEMSGGVDDDYDGYVDETADVPPGPLIREDGDDIPDYPPTTSCRCPHKAP